MQPNQQVNQIPNTPPQQVQNPGVVTPLPVSQQDSHNPLFAIITVVVLLAVIGGVSYMFFLGNTTTTPTPQPTTSPPPSPTATPTKAQSPDEAAIDAINVETDALNEDLLDVEKDLQSL